MSTLGQNIDKNWTESPNAGDTRHYKISFNAFTKDIALYCSILVLAILVSIALTISTKKIYRINTLSIEENRAKISEITSRIESLKNLIGNIDKSKKDLVNVSDDRLIFVKFNIDEIRQSIHTKLLENKNISNLSVVFEEDSNANFESIINENLLQEDRDAIKIKQINIRVAYSSNNEEALYRTLYTLFSRIPGYITIKNIEILSSDDVRSAMFGMKFKSVTPKNGFSNIFNNKISLTWRYIEQAVR